MTADPQLRRVLEQWRGNFNDNTFAGQRLLVLHTAIGQVTSGMDLAEGAPNTVAVTFSGGNAVLPDHLVNGQPLFGADFIEAGTAAVSGLRTPCAYTWDGLGNLQRYGALIGFDLQAPHELSDVLFELNSVNHYDVNVWAGDDRSSLPLVASSNTSALATSTPGIGPAYVLPVNTTARYWVTRVGSSSTFVNPVKIWLIAA
jgi:hypothetical protein